MDGPPEHVLVPLDGSPLAEAALEHALTVYDCRVTVLNVVTPLDGPLSEGGVLEVGEDRREAAEERAETVLERARRQAEDAGREVETAVETGDPAETIVEYAEAHGVDHVVMGSHSESKNALARRLLGTVATAVVGESPVPVTVVR
ncbi:universal stress protein [Natronomonas marina]|jgi:nucleotide-binding universal stress UspA family protein|uniref:universal stress protein n=1 Tax=Natronomonas marina TaxID=2961939 RepID=UPI0020C9790C|nr:universal stress protein [Natronomonas marina]